MRVIVIGAGQVGSAVVEAIHHEHDVTVVDLDQAKLDALSYRSDILTVQGNGASRQALVRAGIRETDLVIASTDRAEVNLVASMLARALCRGKVVARVQSADYLEAWHDNQFDVDFMVSSELECAQAVARAIGLPSAVQTDVFAGGRVQMAEFEVVADRAHNLVGLAIRDAEVPDDCVVASIIRGKRVIIPGGADRIEAGDRIVVISSPDAAQEWARRLAGQDSRRAERVIVVGGGDTGRAIASLLASMELRVQLVERDGGRARAIAEDLDEVTVFQADATDVEFLMREHVGRADVIVCCTDSDATDLLAGLHAKRLGTRAAIAVVNDPAHIDLFEASGIDLALNQRLVTAEEIVRFTHDPRTVAFSMVDHDLGEVIELVVREDSPVIGRPFRDRPLPHAIVGAIIRDDAVIFPRGDDALMGGDQVIVFTDAIHAPEVERTL